MCVQFPTKSGQIGQVLSNRGFHVSRDRANPDGNYDEYGQVRYKQQSTVRKKLSWYPTFGDEQSSHCSSSPI